MSEYKEVIHLDSASVVSKELSILSDIHMVISGGSFCYLKGDAGSGKTSFLKGLYGLSSMKGSRLSVLGQDLAELTRTNLADYRRKIGFISTLYPFFEEKTVFQNLDAILYAIDWKVASEREKRIYEVLDQLDLSKYQGVEVNELPTGIKQKVRVARSLVHKPELILADDLSAHLDNKSLDDVMGAFIVLVKEKQTSVLCAVSDDRLTNLFPARSYLCSDGTITEG